MSATTLRGDTWEMVVVHRVFRREFRLAPALIRAVADGDRARAAIVGEHQLDMVNGLHHHHGAEDELLWPLLAQRVGEPHTELVRRVESQHQRVAELLDRIGALLPDWRDRAEAATRDELATAFAHASTALDEHLTEEETHILPLVDQHITHAEWTALTERGQEFLPKNSKAFVFLGLILQEATPAERAAFLRLLPTPVRLGWHLIGNRIHQRATARLHGTGRQPATA